MDVRLLIVCIIMTEGYGFIIVRDCKNVNMNQEDLRIVLVSVIFFRSRYHGAAGCVRVLHCTCGAVRLDSWAIRLCYITHTKIVP